jgi:competence protein ComEC
VRSAVTRDVHPSSPIHGAILAKPWRFALVRYPAISLAIAFMTGVAVHRVVPVAPGAALFGALVLLIIAFAVRRHGFWFLAPIVLAFTSLGMGFAQRANFRFAFDHVAHFTTDTPRLCFARLYLPHEPRLRTSSASSRLPIPPRQATLAQVLAVRTLDGAWTPASGDALVQIKQAHPQLTAGQTVEIVGFLERPGEALNPGQFDWARYYRDQRTLASIQIREAANIRIVDQHDAPWLTTWREKVRRWLADGWSPARSLDHALVRALVLGDYDPELRDVKEQFRATGTSHHLAISGMHVAIVAGFTFLLLRVFNMSPAVCWGVGLAVVLFYGLVATPSPPVWRSVLLFVVASVGAIACRPQTALQLLAVTVLAMLAWHPLDLFNAGFQLSFGTVLGLMVLSDPLVHHAMRERPILTRAEVERLGSLQWLARKFDEGVVRMVVAGVVAWLVSMPIVALNFDQLNPWQVVASILLGPVVVATLLTGVTKIVLTPIVPPVAPMLADAASSCSAAMRWGVEQLCILPASDVPLPAPPWWVAMLCWVTLAVWVFARTDAKPTLRWGIRIACLASFALLLVGPYVFPRDALRPGSGELRLTLFSVGAGQTALVEPPASTLTSARPVLFDVGSASLFDLVGNVVAPALRERGLTSIDTVLLSHANVDHYSGAAEVVDRYGVREVLVGAGFDALARESSTGESLLRELRTLERPPRVVRAGDRIPLGTKTWLEVIYPETGTDAPAGNDTSMVVRLEFGDTRVLFTGDIQDVAMQKLLARAAREPDLLQADVLIAPHHGSRESTTPAFLTAVNPKLILASNDRTPSGKQRAFDDLTESRSIRLLRTDRRGAIDLRIASDGTWRIDTMRK